MQVSAGAERGVHIMKIAYLIAMAPLMVTRVAWAQDDTGKPSDAPRQGLRSQQSYLDLQAGLLYSDNVLLSPTSGSTDTAALAGFDIDYTRTSNKLSLDALGSLHWVDYLRNTYPSSLLGTINATAQWGQPSDWLQWFARETFGQLSATPLQPATPDTVENVNYVSTGPTLNIPLGSRMHLSVAGYYSNTTYQISPFDSHSLKEGVSLVHGTSGASIGLNGSTEHTVFDNQLANTNYTVDSVFLSYETGVGRSRLATQLGYTGLRFAGDSFKGALIDVRWDRKISYSTNLYLHVESHYSAAPDALRPELVTAAPLGSTIGTSSPDPVKLREAELGVTFSRPRTTVSFLGNVNRQRYVTETDFDQDDVKVEVLFERHVSPSVSVTLQARVENEKFVNLNARIVDLNWAAIVSRTFNRLSLSLRYERHHSTTSGQTNNALLYGFNQNQIGVYVRYGLIGRHVSL